MTKLKLVRYFYSMLFLLLLSAIPSGATEVVIGDPSSTENTSTYPFITNWGGERTQIIINASEMGLPNVSFINSMAFDLINNTNTEEMPNFAVRMQNTTLTELTTTMVVDGFTTVFSGPTWGTTGNGLNTITFNEPFMWDGSSNILIEICRTNGLTNSGFGDRAVRTSLTSTNTVSFNYQDSQADCAVLSTEGDEVSMYRPVLTLDVIPATLPYLTSSPNIGAYGYIENGSISPIKTFLIGGNNLNPSEGDLTITLPYGPAFQVSLDGGVTWLTEPGTIPYVGNPIATPIPLQVRFVPTEELNFKDSVIINGGSATTKIKLTGTSVLQYCAPANYNYGADIARVTVGTFTYTSQAISPVLSNDESNQSYNDYRDSVGALVVKAGTSVPYSLNIINDGYWTSSYYVKVYADLNRDAILDPVTELIDSLYTTWPANGVINGILDIPANAIVGPNTLIRFMLTQAENSAPCMIPSYYYREVEDYWVNFTTPDPYVFTTPKSMNLGYTAPSTISDNGIFDITAGSLTPAAGNLTATVTDNFQISLNGTNWSNTVTMPYSGGSLTSTPLYVHFISPAIPADISGTITFNGGGVSNHTMNLNASGNIQYCSAGFRSSEGIDIANISVSNLQNYGVASAPISQNPLATGTYTNNFNLAPIVQIRSGVPYQFTANIITSFDYSSTCKLKVYIDYNANGLLNDENELVFESEVTAPAYVTDPWTVSGEFMVPGDLIPTNVDGAFPRMRVMLSTNYEVDPCTVETSTDTYGEVEDYKVQILPALPMIYSSTTTTQVGKEIVGAGYQDQKMLRINVYADNSLNPLTVNQLVFNTNGTVPTSAIANAKIFSTGRSAKFATTTQIGETISNPDGEMSFVLATPQTLLPGNNYYWLAYSVAADASLEAVLDAELTGLYVSDAPDVNKIVTPQAPVGFSLVNRMKFDGSFPVATTVFPMDGWTNTSPGNADWRTVENGSYPNNAPHSAPAMAEFDSWNISSGDIGALVSPAFPMNGETEPTTFSLWLFRHDNSTGGDGSIFKVYLNTVPTTTGATLLNVEGYENATEINVRFDQGAVIEPSVGWYQYTYQIPAGFTGETNYLLFEGTSDFYNNIHLDDIKMGEDAFMKIASIDTLRTGMNSFTIGTQNNIVNAFNVATLASNSPLSIDNITVTAEGTTNVADLANAKVWYLGSNASFNPETNLLYGTVEEIINGQMTIVRTDGEEPIQLSEGNNYFAITFDVNVDATPGDMVDCRLDAVTYSRGEDIGTIEVPNGNTWGAHEIKLPMNGTYTIGGPQLETRWYPTLTTAVDDLNLLGMDSDINFAIAGDLVIDPADAPVFLPITNVGVGSAFTLRIYPTTNVTISGAYTGNAGMIIIGATDRIVIDGRINQTGERGLTITNSLNGRELFLTTLIDGGSVDNATIQYVNFVGNDKGNGSSLLMINGVGHTNININHCDFKKSSTAINVSGATSTDKVLNLTIANNNFGDAIVDNTSIGLTALNLNYAANVAFNHNTITNIKATSNFAAVMINDDVTNSVFSFNKINNMVNTGEYRVGGFYVNSGLNSNITFANNSMRGINGNGTGAIGFAPNGFYFNAGGDYKVYNNSVKLEGNRSTINSSVPSTPSTVVYIASSVDGIDIRNNIFVNTLISSVPDLQNYGIYTDGIDAAFTNVDYNNYYVTGNAPFIGHITVGDLSDWATLIEWQAASYHDAMSKNYKVTFAPGLEMHLSAASACNYNLDVPNVSAVEAQTDVDGAMRQSMTKVGVDEVWAELEVTSQPVSVIEKCISTGQDNVITIPVGTYSVSSFSDGIARTLNSSDFQYSWTKNGEAIESTDAPLEVLYTSVPESGDYYQAFIVAPETGLDPTYVSLSEGPTMFILTGTGALCPNATSGVDLTLSGSEVGVFYELMLGDELIGEQVVGTGSPITFSNLTGIGAYDVFAYRTENTSCFTKMTSTAEITEAPLAAPLTVIGGGEICSGSEATLGIGLLGSQMDVTYTLYLNNEILGTPVVGTGSDLSFGTYNTPGTYTVKGTFGTCVTEMTGSAIITTTTAPAAFAVTGGGEGSSPIGLASSEADVTYTLYIGEALIPELSVLGTGSEISFGTFTDAGTYTVKATHGTCTTMMTGTAVITAAPVGFTLSGTLKYANNAQTAMNNCTVIVKLGTEEVARTTTDATGNYSVSSLANGTYTIEVQTTKTSGGLNSLDVASLRKKVGNVVTYTALQLKAGDINNNGSINSLDVAPLRQKIGNLTATNWRISNFVFYPSTVTINGADATLEIKSLCGGDVNGSFTPGNN